MQQKGIKAADEFNVVYWQVSEILHTMDSQWTHKDPWKQEDRELGWATAGRFCTRKKGSESSNENELKKQERLERDSLPEPLERKAALLTSPF